MILAVPDQQEFDHILKVLPQFLINNSIPFTYNNHRLHIDDDYTLLQTGIGIINTARSLKNVREQIIVVGSCGSPTPGLFKVVEAYYDIDLTPFGRPYGNVPGLSYKSRTSETLNRKIDYICNVIPCASVTSDHYGCPFTPDTDLPIIVDMEDRAFLELCTDNVSIVRYATDNNDASEFRRNLPLMGVTLSKFIVNLVSGRKVYDI